MVLQKRLDYGFNGYQVPATPRAARSARRRRYIGKKVEQNQMCAFDLLATVAGKLLLEGETSPSVSNTSTEKVCCAIVNSKDDGEPMKVEKCDKGSCERSYLLPAHGTHACNEDFSLKDSPLHQNDACSGLVSVVTTSDCSEKVNCAEKMVIGKTKNETGSFDAKVELDFSEYRESSNCKLEDSTRKIKVEPLKNGKVLAGFEAGMCNAEDPMVWDGKPTAMVSSDSSAKVPLCEDHIPRSSFPPTRDDVKVVSRDDDENSSWCTHPSTTYKPFRYPPRIGDRRIRKLLASKHWKVAPRLKEEELFNTGGESKSVSRTRKPCYKRQRSERNYPFKKRRLFNRSSLVNSDKGISSAGKLEKGSCGDALRSSPKMRGATGTSASAAGQNALYQSRDSHVKLRIKSFRVPELFIEISETATVGSLKRTVMEAVTAILGGGLRVGVLLQGKKVRDDSKTLLQSGIAHDDQLDALGFTLEPNPSQPPQPLCTGDSPGLLSCDSPQPLIRYPVSSTVVHQGPSDVLPDPPPVTNLDNFVDSDHDSAPSPTDMSVDKSSTDSKALVPVPALSVEALAMVPMHRKSKRCDAAQRRIRRPFSVSEVEALVQAVEKLGTGRWRDVKLRAFDNAKHRTYVDLKDKWKTLVHTARISPQQRRGEPVPQELLDRVLTAHAYWSQQQAKQQLKNQSDPPPCLLL